MNACCCAQAPKRSVLQAGLSLGGWSNWPENTYTFGLYFIFSQAAIFVIHGEWRGPHICTYIIIIVLVIKLIGGHYGNPIKTQPHQCMWVLPRSSSPLSFIPSHNPISGIPAFPAKTWPRLFHTCSRSDSRQTLGVLVIPRTGISLTYRLWLYLLHKFADYGVISSNF